MILIFTRGALMKRLPDAGVNRQTRRLSVDFLFWATNTPLSLTNPPQKAKCMKIIKKKKKRIEYSKISKYFEKRVGLRFSVGMEPQSNSRMREEKKNRTKTRPRDSQGVSIIYRSRFTEACSAI